MKFYHGTSSAFDIEEGDTMDPRKGAFEEGVVYATSDLQVARGWANARCAVAGGEPEVWEVEIDMGEAITVDRVVGDPRELRVRVVIERQGESGAHDAHVVARYGATFARKVA